MKVSKTRRILTLCHCTCKRKCTWETGSRSTYLRLRNIILLRLRTSMFMEDYARKSPSLNQLRRVMHNLNLTRSLLPQNASLIDVSKSVLWLQETTWMRHLLRTCASKANTRWSCLQSTRNKPLLNWSVKQTQWSQESCTIIWRDPWILCQAKSYLAQWDKNPIMRLFLLWKTKTPLVRELLSNQLKTSALSFNR